MSREAIHRFEENGRRYAIDPETCFCFECDEISWDVLAMYPFEPVNRIYHDLASKHSVTELQEVVGELEWLRATRAILPSPKKEDLQKELQTDRGLKRITVQLPRETGEAIVKKKGWFGQGATVYSSSARDIGRDAVTFLLGRSGDQKELEIEFLEPGGIHNPDLVTDLIGYALKQARAAGKKFSASVLVHDVSLAKTPPALEGHTISAKLSFNVLSDIAEHVRGLARVEGESLQRLVKILQPELDGATGRIIVRPNHPKFSPAVEVLEQIGFKSIEFDLDGAYVANPQLNPREMLGSLREAAVYYAKRLLQHQYFRLDPIAPLFYRIYDGSPMRRADPAGTNELAIDDSGRIFPSWRMFGNDSMALGSLLEGELNEIARSRFDEVGATTTGACRRCWARNLCGGGSTAVHLALSGSVRKPNEVWCDAQRAWSASAVSAFNLLSSEGVNFTRMYNALGRTSRPSLFTLVRAAFKMTVGMRPIEEADAEMLVQWENWNPAAYFLFNEKGVMLSSKYEREMDALHPSNVDQEMVLVKKTGEPFGLIKLRAERVQGAAMAWLYMHKDEDYASDDVRKGFRAILKEAGGQQSIRRLTIPSAQYESGLQQFLESIGFSREGTLREALFVHDEYHDIHLYGATTASL